MAGTAPYEKCVFVNCPFDTDYKPILDAIIFTVHYCGFIARIALEDAGSSEPRITKITRLINESRYAIHDLSRIDEPRLNMAFEAGICLGAKLFGGKRHETKDFLILDAEPHQYQKTISDIAGQDGAFHHNDPLEAIGCVRHFLARKAERTTSPFVGPDLIRDRYRQFRDKLPAAAKKMGWSEAELTGLDGAGDLFVLMADWIARNP